MRAAAISWSGGKDCALAAYRALRAGAVPRFLLAMLTEEGRRSRSHGLRLDLLHAQAEAMGVPLVTRAASWDRYEEEMADALSELRLRGAELAVFGDLDFDDNRDWCRSLALRCGLEPLHPVFGEPRAELAAELIDAGFRATVIAVRDGVLGRELLGRTLTVELIEEIERAGADPLGEGGEYHTVVTAGPLFACELELVTGEAQLRDGVWFLDVGT